ncbi:SDR family oxidoreductase [Chloroflexota bacterium]
MSNRVFHENVVIITGASSGIGRELAYQLADQGAWLSLGARDKKRLQDVATECQQRGARTLITQTDVTDQAQCQKLVACTLRAFGRVNTLVNNAGISMWALFEELQDLSIIKKIMRVNFFGSVYCTHYALPHLKKTRGRIVAIASLTAIHGVPTRTGYAASKHAVKGFFDSLRIELAGSGVTVTVSYPDFVATEARQRTLGFDGQPIGESPIDEDKVMTAENCVQILVTAMEKRKREDKQTMKAKLGPWGKLIAPGLIDKIAQKAVHTDD